MQLMSAEFLRVGIGKNFINTVSLMSAWNWISSTCYLNLEVCMRLTRHTKKKIEIKIEKIILFFDFVFPELRNNRNIFHTIVPYKMINI